MSEELKNPSVVYDDVAEAEKYRAARAKQIEEDMAKPFDPEAVLEVRHLRKTFPIQKTLLGKVTREKASSLAPKAVANPHLCNQGQWQMPRCVLK